MIPNFNKAIIKEKLKKLFSDEIHTKSEVEKFFFKSHRHILSDSKFKE